jgi:hypothetical protein
MEYNDILNTGIYGTLLLGVISIILGITSVILYIKKNKHAFKAMIAFIFSAFINFIPLGIIDYMTPFPIYEAIPNFKSCLQIYEITICLCIIPLHWKGKELFPLIISVYSIGFLFFIAYPLCKYLMLD